MGAYLSNLGGDSVDSSSNNTLNNTNNTLININKNDQVNVTSTYTSTQDPHDLITTTINYDNFTTNNNETSDSFTFNDFISNLSNYFQSLDWKAISPWLDIISSVAMVVCCVMPYVPQYRTILKKRSSKGFSTLVCLALLIANILRTAFWFFKKFEITLLVQGLVMIMAQIFLLEICIRMNRYEGQKPNGRSTKRKTERSLFNSSLRYFWSWTDLTSYLLFLMIFCAIIATATYFLLDNVLYNETIGLVSSLTESMLGMPQLIKNMKKKSVAGLSVGMVLMWLLGDTFKLSYFLIKKQPFQFVLCAIIQITIDLLIMIQIYAFSQKKLDVKLDPLKDIVAL